MVFVLTRPASQKTIQRLAEETGMDFLSVIIREAQQSRDKQADEENLFMRRTRKICESSA